MAAFWYFDSNRSMSVLYMFVIRLFCTRCKKSQRHVVHGSQRVWYLPVVHQVYVSFLETYTWHIPLFRDIYMGLNVCDTLLLCIRYMSLFFLVFVFFCVYYVCLFYMCFTCALHVFYICFTCVLHVFYMCFTCVLHVFGACSVWFRSVMRCMSITVCDT